MPQGDFDCEATPTCRPTFPLLAGAGWTLGAGLLMKKMVSVAAEFQHVAWRIGPDDQRALIGWGAKAVAAADH